MRYHNITKDDMLNGDGLRVVLWLAGCEHHCKGCQNPVTWDVDGGLLYDANASDELMSELKKPYISGITFSGGDPLHPKNRCTVLAIAEHIKRNYKNKTVWLYTGYTWEAIRRLPGIEYIDVIVDGKFIEELKDNSLPWKGSSNQRVILVQASLQSNSIITREV